MPNRIRPLSQLRILLDIGSSDCSGLTACSILFNRYALLNLHMHRLAVFHSNQYFSVVCLPHQANHFQVLFRRDNRRLFCFCHICHSLSFACPGAGCLSGPAPGFLGCGQEQSTTASDNVPGGKGVPLCTLFLPCFSFSCCSACCLLCSACFCIRC